MYGRCAHMYSWRVLHKLLNLSKDGATLPEGFWKDSYNVAPSQLSPVVRQTEQGTPWVIVVRATTTQGGRVFAQVAATAALDVRALDARNGVVVASAQKQAKGVGRTPEAAQQAAASEAGLDAGNDLAALLVAKENEGL